jgi:hypothetical protein
MNRASYARTSLFLPQYFHPQAIVTLYGTGNKVARIHQTHHQMEHQNSQCLINDIYL